MLRERSTAEPNPLGIGIVVLLVMRTIWSKRREAAICAGPLGKRQTSRGLSYLSMLGRAHR
jgi:hypothetical protein